MPTAAFPVPASTASMEAKLVEALPTDDGWQFEPKWDGFRCLAFREGDQVELHAKSGKPLGRFFPEIVQALAALPVTRFAVDGELAIPVGDSLAFDALQMRLHPAESRIRKLSQQTPALYMLFDCLAGLDGLPLIDAPLAQRRQSLEALFAAFGPQPRLRLSPFTRSAAVAKRWLDRSGGALDGVVANASPPPRCG